MNRRGLGVFYGWWVVAASAVGLFWGVPVAVYSFSVFLKPLMQDFHAGRGAVSFAFTLQQIVGALSTPLTGWLIGRYGARKVVLSANAMFGMILLFNRTFSTTLWHLLPLLCSARLSGTGNRTNSVWSRCLPLV